jgi:hypothetical protein
MKNITAKIFGLPKTGTNVLRYLLNINFNINVCQESHYSVDYLGWKHSVPQKIEAYNFFESKKNTKILFFMCLREYSSWEKSIANFAKNSSFEFDYAQDLKAPFIFYTPSGPELYKDSRHLYDEKNSKYLNFFLANDSNCFLVNFNDIKNNQKKLLLEIKNKFNIDPIEEEFIEIKKPIKGTNLIYC